MNIAAHIFYTLPLPLRCRRCHLAACTCLAAHLWLRRSSQKKLAKKKHGLINITLKYGSSEICARRASNKQMRPTCLHIFSPYRALRTTQKAETRQAARRGMRIGIPSRAPHGSRETALEQKAGVRKSATLPAATLTLKRWRKQISCAYGAMPLAARHAGVTAGGLAAAVALRRKRIANQAQLRRIFSPPHVLRKLFTS